MKYFGKTINNNPNKLYFSKGNKITNKEKKLKKNFLSFGCHRNKSKWQINYVHNRKSSQRSVICVKLIGNCLF